MDVDDAVSLAVGVDFGHLRRVYIIVLVFMVTIESAHMLID